MKNKFYITTPIYYVNDKPHIGHAYTTVAADIFARWHRILGDETFFLTGTDEHGAKITECAQKEGLNPKEFVDKIVPNFINAWKKLNIKYDYFIRTTNIKHEEFVKNFLQKLYDEGYIYKGKYEGLYCIDCEKYITESDLVNGKCPYHPHKELRKMSEETYFFKLSEFKNKLIKAIEDPKDENHFEILPIERKNEILNRLKAEVKDISLSRSEISWGVQVPWDKKHTFYVWFDALLNYASALEINNKNELWPPELQLLGKDILWFHTVIWQAMLMAAGKKMPKVIFAHGFWTVNGQKMSKSLGNVVDPFELAEKYGVDTIRYYMFRGVTFGQDGDFSMKDYINRINGDLADGLGNLLNRSIILIEKLTKGKVRKIEDDEFSKRIKILVEEFKKNMELYKLNICLELVWKFIAEINKYITEEKVWEIKNEDKKEKIIYKLYEALRIIAILINPFMPETSEKILSQLGLNKDELKVENLYFGKIKEVQVKKGEILFKKVEYMEEKQKEEIDIDYFKNIKLKVAAIKEAEKVEGSKKLLKLKISLGEEERQIVAGIGENYSPEELIGKKIIVVANLKYAKLKGIESQGMLLAAEDGNNIALLTVDKDVKDGAEIH